MDDILDHELATFFDSLSLPANAETAISKVYERDRTSVTPWPTTHIVLVVKEVVETVTEWMEHPIHTQSSGNIFPQGVKPAFRPRVVNTIVESGAGTMATQENMSYVGLLAVFLLVLAAVSVANAVGLRVYRKYWGLETVSVESSSDKNPGRIVRGRENRKRERRWRYEMSGFMKRPAGAAEAKGRVEDNEKVWEDVEN